MAAPAGRTWAAVPAFQGLRRAKAAGARPAALRSAAGWPRTWLGRRRHAESPGEEEGPTAGGERREGSQVGGCTVGSEEKRWKPGGGSRGGGGRQEGAAGSFLSPSPGAT